MSAKKTLLTVLLISSIFTLSFTKNSPKDGLYEDIYKSTEVNGEVTNPKGSVYNGPEAKWDSPSKIFYQSENREYSITAQEISDIARTYYDYQSSGTIRYIVQDPSNPNNLYVVFMSDGIGIPPGFSDRRTRFFTSFDNGTTWEFVTNVPYANSGFPSIDILSNGVEIIAVNTSDGGYSSVYSQIYVDVAPGAGSFTRITPPSLILGDEPLWPKIAATQNISHTRKFVLISSQRGNTNSFTNTCSSISNPGFSGWISKPDICYDEGYAISRASNGKIGIVYTNNDYNNSENSGDVNLIESTDDGLTFGQPRNIWHTNFTTDSIGCLRSIDLCYIDTVPKVIFSVVKINPTYWSSYPGSLCKTMCWSPNISGGNPVIIDTCSNMKGTNPQHDGFYSSCRPVIGRSTNNNMLFAAWCRSRTDTGTTGNNFFDIYLSYSGDGGANWYGHSKITNTAGPLRDCRYVSMSQTNNNNGNAEYYVYMVYQMDSIPGSFVNGAQKSLAKLMFEKHVYEWLGIENNNNIAFNYSLSQNYPNPFNPSTVIKYSIAKAGNVQLVIYDINGRVVRKLVDGQSNAGNHEAEFDGSSLASGVYIYTIMAGDFIQTKKMVLLK